jgi:hypothetical protein
MLCDRDMIHNMCGPLIKTCKPYTVGAAQIESTAAQHLFLTNIMRRYINCVVTVNNSVIMAYHNFPNNHERLYLHRSLFFL